MMTASSEADFLFQNGVITGYTGAGGDVVIPATIGGQAVTSIGSQAFAGSTTLARITIPRGVTSIGQSAFHGCASLTHLSLPDTLVFINHAAFYGCRSLADAVIPEGVTWLASEAFSDCTSLRSIAFPSTVQTVSGDAFRMCDSLTTITVSEQSSYYTTRDGALYSKDMRQLVLFPRAYSGEYVIPSGVTTIGRCAFYQCASLTRVTIPQGVVVVGEWAFSQCVSIDSIRLPSSVSRVGTWAFLGCRALTAVDLSAGLTALGAVAFRSCPNLIEINVPDANVSFKSVDGVLYDKGGLRLICCPAGKQGVFSLLSSATAVGDHAFETCAGITAIELPSGLMEVGNTPFVDCTSLTTISVSSESKFFKSVDGVLYDKAGSRLICCPPGKQGRLSVLQGVTQIDNSACWKCWGLTGITLPNSLARIGDWAFLGSSGLSDIKLPASLVAVGAGAFQQTGVRNITMPASVTSLGHGVVYDCPFLTSVTLPSTLTRLPAGTFAFCPALTNVTLPVGLTSIGDHAFYSCTSLTSIAIPLGLTDVGDSAFKGCTGLMTISFPASVTNISGSAFSGCTALRTVCFSGNAPVAGLSAFTGTAPSATIYYRAGTTGWTNPFAGLPTKVASVPSAPTSLTVTPANGRVTLTWAAPTSSSPPIADYVIQYSANGGKTWTTFSDGVATTRSTTITGLTNGTSYVFRVAAQNLAGQGEFSANSSFVTPRTAPSAPTRVKGTRGNGQVRLTWAPPVSNGGSFVTDYVIQYRATTASTWTTFEDGVSTSRSTTITGLTNGTSYVFRVAAKNAAGTGAASAISAAVTPRLPTPRELLRGLM